MVLSSDLPNSTLVRNIQSSSRSTEGHKISSYQRPFRHWSRSTNLLTWGSLVRSTVRARIGDRKHSTIVAIRTSNMLAYQIGLHGKWLASRPILRRLFEQGS